MRKHHPAIKASGLKSLEPCIVRYLFCKLSLSYLIMFHWFSVVIIQTDQHFLTRTWNVHMIIAVCLTPVLSPILIRKYVSPWQLPCIPDGISWLKGKYPDSCSILSKPSYSHSKLIITQHNSFLTWRYYWDQMTDYGLNPDQPGLCLSVFKLYKCAYYMKAMTFITIFVPSFKSAPWLI